MPIIRITLQAELLNAADAASKRLKISRSALVRNALREYLSEADDLQAEGTDRRGYLAKPQGKEEFDVWQAAAAWPGP